MTLQVTIHQVRACIPYTLSDSDEAATVKNESGDEKVEMILEIFLRSLLCDVP